MVVYEKQPILDKFQTVLNFFRHISYSIMTLFRGLLSSSDSWVSAHANANSLAAARQSRAPGKARMPAALSRCGKPVQASTHTQRDTISFTLASFIHR